jgi:hypothetical protein
MKQLSKNHLIPAVAIAFIALGIIIFGAVNLLHKKPHLPNLPNYPSPPTPIPIPKKVTDLINSLGEKTSLPGEETPSVATVTDINKLPNVAFFAKAEKGDKVLIYTAAKKAYLYRPSTGQIIQEGAVEVVSPDVSTSAEASTGQSATASAQQELSNPVLKVRY